MMAITQISVRGARQHNLNISVDILAAFTAITGLKGVGMFCVGRGVMWNAFSLCAAVSGLDGASDVDAIDRLSPSISVSRRPPAAADRLANHRKFTTICSCWQRRLGCRIVQVRAGNSRQTAAQIVQRVMALTRKTG
jgi:excinuclease UvrABC ATPase subunit